MNNIRRIRVIMPVGSDPEFAEKKAAIDKGIRKSGREPIFPALTPPKGFRSFVFLNELKNVELVIADVTLERPSCYYELGIVEGAGKNVYLIAKSGTPIHQCENRQAVHFYSDMSNLTKIIEELLKD